MVNSEQDPPPIELVEIELPDGDRMVVPGPVTDRIALEWWGMDLARRIREGDLD